jgi:hypothetical protein
VRFLVISTPEHNRGGLIVGIEILVWVEAVLLSVVLHNVQLCIAIHTTVWERADGKLAFKVMVFVIHANEKVTVFRRVLAHQVDLQRVHTIKTLAAQ